MSKCVIEERWCVKWMRGNVDGSGCVADGGCGV